MRTKQRLAAATVWSALLVAPVLLALTLDGRFRTTRAALAQNGEFGRPADLPAPSSLPLPEYERVLFRFLDSRRYDSELGWRVDKRVRDTGPFLKGQYYGTHLAVRIYYSPRVMRWLTSGRIGQIPDGAIIVKEMFDPPAARYEGLTDQQLLDTTDNQLLFCLPMSYEEQLPATGTIALPASIRAQFQANSSSSGQNPAPKARVERTEEGVWRVFGQNKLFTIRRQPASAPCVDPLAAGQEQLGNTPPSDGAKTATVLNVYMKNWQWTVMVKDSRGSEDGWFWAQLGSNMTFDERPYEPPYRQPFNYPSASFGLYCLRCHASAQSPGESPEYTFSTLDNIKGFPGQPLTYRVDNSWRDIPVLEGGLAHHDPRTFPVPEPAPLRRPNEQFLKTFPSIGALKRRDVSQIPPLTYDWVVSAASGPEKFLTSNQCLSCHAGLLGPFGPTMYLQAENEASVNVSPYGEWRWSPMGLGGRDPIFYSQLEWEIVTLEKEFGDESPPFVNALVNTCLRCHGAMGLHQFDIDHGIDFPKIPQDAKDSFRLEFVQRTRPAEDQPPSQFFKYGALARDGISCTVCHHLVQGEDTSFEHFLMNHTTGQGEIGPADQINGPFDDVATYPMQHGLGITPGFNPYLQDSQMCGTCHTINLPNVDQPIQGEPTVLDKAEKVDQFKGFSHELEQVTYLEWVNSQFQNELEPFDPDTAQSCQDCHMPTGYHNDAGTIAVEEIQTQIAIVQDQGYPASANLAPVEDITVQFRDEGFRRHRLQGLNVFLLEMFNQFEDILGMRKVNYNGLRSDLPHAIDNMVQQARERTIVLTVSTPDLVDDALSTSVRIQNLAGHRAPSGVGFRRLFVEFLVFETADPSNVLWASGRTDSVGVILGPDGQALPSEFFTDGAYQPHYQTITEQTQVQIYEELVQNAKGEFTSSFIHRDTPVKDNRLLPKGWTERGPAPDQLKGPWLKSTHPEGKAVEDPDYRDPGGAGGGDNITYAVPLAALAGLDPSQVSVQATVYSQSIPPHYLRARFSGAPNQPDVKRLYYIASHLRTDGTPIQDWKFELVSVVKQGQ